MKKNVKIAKKLIKIAKHLIGSREINADLHSKAGIDAFIQAANQYANNPQGMALLENDIINNLVQPLIATAQNQITLFDRYIQDRLAMQADLKAKFAKSLGQIQKSRSLKPDDIEELEKHSLVRLRNLMQFHTVTPGMFPQLDLNNPTTKSLNENVPMKNLMLDPNNMTDIVVDPDSPVTGPTTQYLNLPWGILMYSKAVGQFDLLISRLAMTMRFKDIDNKFKQVALSSLDKLGHKLYIALGKQPAMLKNFMRGITATALSNNLLKERSTCLLGETSSFRSIIGIITDETGKILVYDTSISEALTEIENCREREYELVDQKRAMQEKNPALLKKQKEMPEYVTRDEEIKGSNRSRRNELLTANKIRKAGFGDLINSFKEKVKSLWNKTKECFNTLSELMFGYTNEINTYSKNIIKYSNECINEIDDKDEKIMNSFNSFINFIVSLEKECDKVINEKSNE